MVGAPKKKPLEIVQVEIPKRSKTTERQEEEEKKNDGNKTNATKKKPKVPEFDIMVQDSDTNSVGNNIVALSDYEAALKGLESVFQDVDDPNPIFREFYQAAHASLVSNLSRIVQPVEDSKYHALIDPYHIVEEDDGSDQEEMVEANDEDAAAADELIDEEDLLDNKALKDAQRLRTHVRILSQRVQQIRERVLNKAESSSSSSELQPDVPLQVNEVPEEDRVDLVESLEKLKNTLNHSQWAKLPTQMKSLQDTIAVIQKESTRPMSQTEVAIISRSNSEEEGISSILTQEDQDLSASNRLARFFQQYS